MEWAQQFVEQYGYWAVFLWTLIEGETVFIAAAALAAAGIMQPWKVIVVAASGAFIGHLIFFSLGRWRGMQIIESIPSLHRHYPKANIILDKYAHWSIFIFQYLYGTRMVAAILFGCSSLEFWRFFILQIVNCISWSIIIYMLGHLLGVAGMVIIEHFGLYGLLAALAIAAIAGGWGYWRYAHQHVRNHFQQNTDDHPPQD